MSDYYKFKCGDKVKWSKDPYSLIWEVSHSFWGYDDGYWTRVYLRGPYGASVTPLEEEVSHLEEAEVV